MQVDSLNILPTEDFEKFYYKDILGRLFFPNGKNTDNNIQSGENNKYYFAKLEDLYENIMYFMIDKKSILSLGLVGIVATGDAIKYPDYTIEPIEHRKRWKFKNGLFRRNYVSIDEKVPIQPTKAEFLVVTEKDPIPEKCVGKTSRAALCRYSGRNGINLTVRGINQVVNGINDSMNEETVCTDKECIDALQNGVPIIFDHQLKYIMETSGAENYNPQIPEWHLEDKSVWGIIRKVN